MHNKQILVVGSINIDIVIKTAHLPKRGESLLSRDYMMVSGGKGANQAVAAARLGAEVLLAGKVGDDVFSEMLLKNLKKAGVRTDFVIRSARTHTGIAFITVDRRGENMIVVAGGANTNFSAMDIKKLDKLMPDTAVMLVQLEIPVKTVSFAISLAQKHCVPVFLDPGPAQKCPVSLLRAIRCPAA